MQRLQVIKAQISSQKALSGKTVVITGGSRGIGLAIGLRCAQDGANIAILAKTVTPQPNLPGISSLKKEPFTLLLRISRKQEEKHWLFLVISVMSKVSRRALRKWYRRLEGLIF